MVSSDGIKASHFPLPDKKYTVVYADPPWEYRQCGATAKSRGTALKQYQTMATAGCPYPLALAVAETESNFDQFAVGAVGEVGIMQLNPGPGGTYHAELAAATGQDPTTPTGNIVCGVYLLGKYMMDYGDPARAAMAYNMGAAGAVGAWAAGINATNYSATVLEAMERWECLVNPWGGI